jgi:hypothetical protein
MNYKIKYMKPPNYVCGGFSVMLNSTINILSFLEYNNIEFKPYFEWSNDLFYDVEKGENIFDYYFYNNEKQNENLEITNIDNINVSGWRENFYINMNSDIGIDNNKILNLNKIFNRYIKIKDNLIEDINIFGKSLGIQYRYTDKLGEVNKQLDPMKFIEIVKSKLDEYDIIFLATDYNPIIDELKNFSDKIQFIDAVRSDDILIGTHFQKFDRKLDNYLKGLECLTDFVTLSKCTDFFYSRSNVSLLALIINGGKYNEISLLNDM